uniref:Dynein light chain n=1 Tax=Trichuris muris TaxID=70415 RepID=A0A5S6Q5T7_TRIMR
MATASKVGLSLEDLTAAAKEQIELVLSMQSYSHENAALWNRMIVSNIIAQLGKFNAPYKFMVTCVIMQKGGAGLHVASGSFWDTASDVAVSVRWENKFVNCVVEIFAVAQ